MMPSLKGVHANMRTVKHVCRALKHMPTMAATTALKQVPTMAPATASDSQNPSPRKGGAEL